MRPDASATAWEIQHVTCIAHRFKLIAESHQGLHCGIGFACGLRALRDAAEKANSVAHVQSSSDTLRPVGNSAFTRYTPRMNPCAAMHASEPAFSFGSTA